MNALRPPALSVLACALLVACTISATAQSEQERIDALRVEQSEREKAQQAFAIDSAVRLMDAGDYKGADLLFRGLLTNMKSVPSDFTFYFGKNSFYLDQFKQSIDWLNKYIALKGTSGRFYDEATTLLKRAEASYLAQKSVDAVNVQQILSGNYDVDCGPSGMVICPVCRGRRVIIRKGPFGDTYSTCPYCNEHGLLTCEQYNRLVRGELQPESN